MGKKAAGRTERRPLSRELIIEAAIVLVERDGARGLSMRKVAAELGVGVMSLYNHVPDREALVDGIAITVLAGLNPPSGLDPAADWKVNARLMVDAFRATAHRYPRSMHLVFTSRIDLEFKWTAAEQALAYLASAGFDGETSVRALRALMSFAIGAQMMVHGVVRVPGTAQAEVIETVMADPERYPHAIALAHELARPPGDADFDRGLEMLLSALDRLPRQNA
ncbi:TetR/AcrR family transcriptional regulator C-terminal domain-containing protein [Spirillospora sp. NPDC047279]|uniref:TetR/AcrR family transcriptional regulator C-terminal domain-containing protein n=1 Tax=Spirillospora sp. NPDC047279 TaxID=3155478 RepID=UPI0033F4A997